MLVFFVAVAVVCLAFSFWWLFTREKNRGGSVSLLSCAISCAMLVYAGAAIFNWAHCNTQINTVEKISTSRKDEIISEFRYLESGETFTFTPPAGYFHLFSTGPTVVVQGEITEEGTYKEGKWAIAPNLPVTISVKENYSEPIKMIVDR